MEQKEPGSIIYTSGNPNGEAAFWAAEYARLKKNQRRCFVAGIICVLFDSDVPSEVIEEWVQRMERFGIKLIEINLGP